MAVVDSLFAEGLSVRFRAGGRSMLPVVRDGDCLTVSPVRPADVGPGDVLLCDTRRGPIAHRVLSVATGPGGERRFTLRGDASRTCDVPVAEAEVRGRVVSVERAGRAVRLPKRGGWLRQVAASLARQAPPALTAAARLWLAPLRELPAGR